MVSLAVYRRSKDVKDNKILMRGKWGSDQREFHLTAQLSEAPDALRFTRPLDSGGQSGFDKLTAQGQNLSLSLLAIEGVWRITVMTYSVTVEKGVAFIWEDILLRATQAVREVFPEHLRESVQFIDEVISAEK